MDIILTTGIIIVIAFFGGLLAKKLKFPLVTGYIIIGILLSLTHLIPRELITGKPGSPGLSIITDIALAIVAYLVGGSLKLKDLRKLGRDIVWITPFQAAGAWILVTLPLVFLCRFIMPGISNATLLNTYFPMALVLGAISCATAPAATVAIMHEYKAKGSFTTTLLAIIVLDDAIAVIAFAIAMGIAKPLTLGSNISLYQMLGAPTLYIIKSIGLGVIFGIGLVYMSKLAKRRGLSLVVVLGVIFLCTGLANFLNISSILANIVVGFVVTNMVKRREVFSVIEGIEDILFAMFFTLAGMHFDFSVIKVAGILALLITIFRCLGKLAGARVGATIAHSSPNIKSYLGFGLLPKAGVTVGLVILAGRSFPVIGNIMVNAVLASVIINELIAPPLMKYALFKSGEAKE